MTTTKEHDRLADRMKRGDESAFSEFVRIFDTELYRMFLLMGASEADAEDLAVSSLSRAAIKIHLYSAGRDQGLSRWVHAVARNTFMDSKRSRTRQMAGARSLDLAAGAVLPEFLDDEPLVTVTELKGVLDGVLMQLSEVDREIVLGRVGDRKVPFRELADRFAISEGNARKHYERTIERLERSLADDPKIKRWSDGWQGRNRPADLKETKDHD
jgi:RNA polymerase sigma factor (sigma-70 family)